MLILILTGKAQSGRRSLLSFTVRKPEAVEVVGRLQSRRTGGMQPVNWLSPRCKFCRLDRSPRSGGIVPVKSLDVRFSSVTRLGEP